MPEERARDLRRAVREGLVGLAQVVIAVLTAPWRRAAYNRWGAARSEVLAPMPGDSLVANPRLGYTRAIAIDAPPESVWPWLVQMGQGRGGLYSFDALENMIGCRIHSVDTILPEHQSLAPGDLVRMGPVGYPCFRVMEVMPGVALALLGADPKPPHATPPPGEVSAAGVATWQWALRPFDGGRLTRLVVRQRLDYPDRARWVWRVVEPIAFVMEREMLRGIKRRAEGGGEPHGS